MNAAMKEQPYYTYGDVLEWADDVRAEIIDGEFYMMADPTTTHQIIAGELYGQFYNLLKGKPCRAFFAPFGIRAGLFFLERGWGDLGAELNAAWYTCGNRSGYIIWRRPRI